MELSSKVVDCLERLRATLLHELCHVGAWVRKYCPSPGSAACILTACAATICLASHVSAAVHSARQPGSQWWPSYQLNSTGTASAHSPASAWASLSILGRLRNAYASWHSRHNSTHLQHTCSLPVALHINLVRLRKRQSSCVSTSAQPLSTSCQVDSPDRQGKALEVGCLGTQSKRQSLIQVGACLPYRCGKEYRRHSKSVDPARHACGACGALLLYVGKFARDGTPAQRRAPAAFSLFVRDHFAAERAAAAPGTPHAAIMRGLSAQWRARKQELAGLTT